MQVLQDRTLVVRTRFPARITETIPTSSVVKDLGEERFEVAVPWDWTNAEKLTHMRIKGVPSPIQRDYKWPRPMGFEPVFLTDRPHRPTRLSFELEEVDAVRPVSV